MKHQKRTSTFSLRLLAVLTPLAALMMAPRVLAQNEAVQNAADAVVNGGFESGLNGWTFNLSGNAKARGETTRDDAHSGQSSLRIVNSSAFAPNVYGNVMQEVTGLKPNTKYQISAWAKAKRGGIAWIGGGPDWTLRSRFPSGTYDWRRVSTSFTTGADQTTWNLVILSEDPVTELLIDDVEIVEASQAQRARLYAPSVRSGGAASTRGTTISLQDGEFAPDSYVASDEISGTFRETTATARPAQQLTLALKKADGASTEIGYVKLPAAPAGATREVKFAVPAAPLAEGDYQITASLGGAKTVATANLSRRELRAQIAALLSPTQARLAQLQQLASTRKLENNAYVRLGLTIANRYIKRVQSKGPDGQQNDDWSWLQLREAGEYSRKLKS